MGDISVKFRNNTDKNGMVVVEDVGRDPVNLPKVYEHDLDSGSETEWITINDKGELIITAPEGVPNARQVSDGDIVDILV